MSFLEIISGAFFPDRCVGCSAKGSLLCSACRKRIGPAPGSDQPFAASLYPYADPCVRRLVKLLKYKNTRHAAGLFGAPLAGMLAEFIGEEGLVLGGRDVLIVPVPLSKGRMKSRGYNQAELLAKAMLAEFARTAPSGRRVKLDLKLLEKHAETPAQADIAKRSERLGNLGDCFRALPGRVSGGEAVVLVDDVTTTGATLAACKRALEAAGFRHIHALTVAH